MSRSKKLIALRPEIEVRDTSITAQEIFQNNVLRPILKFQHNLIVDWFDNQIMNQKIELKENAEKKLKNLLAKNSKLQSELKGLVIGHFTTLEYRTYKEYSKDLGKRIVQMSIQRYLSQR